MKIRTFIASAFITLAFASGVSAAQTVTVEVDGVIPISDTPAQIINGRTMVHMRSIFSALGAEVDWDARSKTVNAVRGGVSVSITADSPSLIKNGVEVPLDSPAVIVNGRTMVPVRAVSESFGCIVEWDAASKTVKISTAPGDDALTDRYSFAKRLSRPAPVSDELTRDEEMYMLHDNARYMFEQQYLAAVLADPEDSRAAAAAVNEDAAFDRYIKSLWQDCADLMTVYALDASEESYVISSQAELDTLLDSFQKKAELEADKNIATVTGAVQNGTRVGIIGIADDYTEVCCAYIAVFYDRTRGFRIYTLEYDPFIDGFMLCGVSSGSRSNFGVHLQKSDTQNAYAFLKAADETDIKIK